MKRTLAGHTTPETAYVVEDYPYGFRLRCKIRYWLEYKKGQGYRLVSQTTNPKKAGEVWNKPKASTYAPLGVMLLDDEDHVTWTSLRPYAEPEEIEAFATTHAEALTGKTEQDILRYMKALQRASKRVTWTVRSGDDGKPGQTMEEQASIIRALTMDELRKDRG